MGNLSEIPTSLTYAKITHTQLGGSILEHTRALRLVVRATRAKNAQVHFVGSDHSEEYLDMVKPITKNNPHLQRIGGALLLKGNTKRKLRVRN